MIQKVDKDVVRVIGVKGFDKNLKCRNMQYEIGNEYLMDIDKVKICQSGFHFSPTLNYASTYYGNYSGNRFCIVSSLIHKGNLKKWSQKDKYVSNHIRIHRELTKEEVKSILDQERKFKKYTLEEIYKLKELKIIQTAYPNYSVGGSVGLFLQGFNIKREKPISDFDFVIPYYERLSLNSFQPKDVVTEVDQMDDCKNSGNDFDYTNGITIKGEFMLMDMKINPKARYNIVNYEGFDYKVCPWEIIIQAKMNYLNSKSGKKHRKDLLDMFGNPTPIVKEKEELSIFDQIIKKEFNGEL